MNNNEFLDRVAAIVAEVPKGNTHTVKVEMTITFDEMDGTPEQTAEIALELLEIWAQDHAFEMETAITNF